eukprot:Opistho-1_new@91765
MPVSATLRNLSIRRSLRRQRAVGDAEGSEPAAVGDGGLVGAHVQLTPERQRQPFGALRLDDGHVLADDQRGERLHGRFAVQHVVVRGEQHPADAALRLHGRHRQHDRLGGAGAVPVDEPDILDEAGRQRPRHVVLVADVGAAGRHRVGRLRLPDAHVADGEAVVAHLDVVVLDLGVLLRAEHAGVHEREVRDVDEVLDGARPARLVGEGAAEEEPVRAGVDLRERRDVALRLAETGPDEAVALRGAEGRGAGPRRRLLALVRRIAHADAVGAVFPAVIGAGEPPVRDLAERQLDAAVGAAVFEGAEAVRRAPEHHIDAEQADRMRSVGDVRGAGDRVPLGGEPAVVRSRLLAHRQGEAPLLAGLREARAVEGEAMKRRATREAPLTAAACPRPPRRTS